MSEPFKMKGFSGFGQGTGSSPFTKPEKSRTREKDNATGYESSNKGFKSSKGVKAYQETQSGITANMTKGELRDYVLKTNKGKSRSDASRISMNAAIKLWRQAQEVPVVEEKPTSDVEQKETSVYPASKIVESNPDDKTTDYRKGSWSGGFKGEGSFIPETDEDKIKAFEIGGGSGRHTR